MSVGQSASNTNLSLAPISFAIIITFAKHALHERPIRPQVDFSNHEGFHGSNEGGDVAGPHRSHSSTSRVALDPFKDRGEDAGDKGS
jgi:hypothetical protein